MRGLGLLTYKYTFISLIQYVVRHFQLYILAALYEGESNENLKRAIKIRTTAGLSCKLTTVILMV